MNNSIIIHLATLVVGAKWYLSSRHIESKFRGASIFYKSVLMCIYILNLLTSKTWLEWPTIQKLFLVTDIIANVTERKTRISRHVLTSIASLGDGRFLLPICLLNEAPKSISFVTSLAGISYVAISQRFDFRTLVIFGALVWKFREQKVNKLLLDVSIMMTLGLQQLNSSRIISFSTTFWLIAACNALFRLQNSEGDNSTLKKVSERCRAVSFYSLTSPNLIFYIVALLETLLTGEFNLSVGFCLLQHAIDHFNSHVLPIHATIHKVLMENPVSSTIRIGVELVLLYNVASRHYSKSEGYNIILATLEYMLMWIYTFDAAKVSYQYIPPQEPLQDVSIIPVLFLAALLPSLLIREEAYYYFGSAFLVVYLFDHCQVQNVVYKVVSDALWEVYFVTKTISTDEAPADTGECFLTSCVTEPANPIAKSKMGAKMEEHSLGSRLISVI